MKKVLALVLALIMICTLAFASWSDMPQVTGNSVTTELNPNDYRMLYQDNTQELPDFDKVVKMTKTVTEPTIIKDGNSSTTVYTDTYYVLTFEGGDFEAFISVSVTETLPYYKLISKGKVVDYLVLYQSYSMNITTSDVVSKVIPAKDEVTCGDYDITGTDLYVVGEHVYPLEPQYYYAGNYGLPWQFVYYNGAFIELSTALDYANVIVPHTFSNTKYKSTDGTITAVYCTTCKTFIPVVEKVPAESADLYVQINSGVATGYYYLKSSDTSAHTTNPDTGANNIIGIAAALSFVALASGAAISLKK